MGDCSILFRRIFLQFYKKMFPYCCRWCKCCFQNIWFALNFTKNFYIMCLEKLLKMCAAFRHSHMPSTFASKKVEEYNVRQFLKSSILGSLVKTPNWGIQSDLVPISANQEGLCFPSPSIVPPVITIKSSMPTAQALCLGLVKGSSTLHCCVRAL
jgi:hypothetical protein